MKHPDGKTQLNYVIDFFMDACDAPLMIYLRCARPALLKALIAYYALDMVQIFTRYVKPPGLYKGQRGGSHGKGDRKRKPPRTWRRRWRSWTGFDPNNAIGDLLPGEADETFRKPTPGVRTLWHLYDFEQRALYWVMVAEIVQEFFYDWVSGVAESEYCKNQYRPMVYAVSATDGNIAVLPLSPIVIETIVKARNGGTASGNGASVPGYGSVCVFSAKMVDPRADPAPAGQRLAIFHSTGSVIYSNDFAGPGSEAVVTGGAKAPGTWFCFTTGPLNYIISDLEVTVIGGESQINDDFEDIG